MNKRPHSIDIEGIVLDADELVELISPVFANQNPDVVGAALAQLLAIFIASHGPPLRAPSRKLLIDCADQLVPVVEVRHRREVSAGSGDEHAAGLDLREVGAEPGRWQGRPQDER